MQVRSENLLRERASFDFSCPRGELLLTRLHWDFHGWSGRTSATYGVAGCGRQATYVLADADTWVMDTSRTTAPAPQWAPVPAYPPVAAAPWPPPEAPVSVPPPIASIATVVVVAPPATDTTVMPPAEGLPESPSRSDVEAALNPLADAVRGCAAGDASRVWTEIEFRGATGRPTRVGVESPLGTAVATCIGTVLLDAAVPPFARESLVVRYPWDL
jgi:hypothetical protein